MATNVILPALGMAQETGKIVQWLKAEGASVKKGEPLVEIETDKATVEIEAPADGILFHVSARNGDEVPVGEVIATLLDANSTQEPAKNRRSLASPKARRLAVAQGKNLAEISGSGPGGSVLAADVLAVIQQAPPAEIVAQHNDVPQARPHHEIPSEAISHNDLPPAVTPQHNGVPESVSSPYPEAQQLSPGTIWQIMAERTQQSWTTVPHFSLVREVNASRFMAWRTHASQQAKEKITYTDLLTRIVAASLTAHPRLNASWLNGKIVLKPEIHIGLATAMNEGLVVPVIHRANTLSLSEIARRRGELIARAQAGKLRPQDISEGTFTISNLGMYGIDAFNAIINQPQAAILAVGRIAERIVPLNGQPAVQPMMTLTLSCDHRAIDGAGAALFLRTIANLIEEPLGLLDAF